MLEKVRNHIPLIIAALLVLNILLLGLVISIRSGVNPKPSDLNITPAVTETVEATPYPTPVRVATSLGVRTPGTIEEVVLLAEPQTSEDSVAMIRLVVVNAEVLDFIPAGNFTMGSCDFNKLFTTERVCADVAKSSPFVKGEPLGTIRIKWGEGGMIYREEGDGYFNGMETSLTIPSDMLVAGSFRSGKVAGAAETNTRDYFVEGVILIGASILILGLAIAGIYLLLLKPRQQLTEEDYQKGSLSIKVIVAGSLAILMIAALVVAAMVANSVPEEESSIVPTSTPVYVTVYPSVTSSLVPSITLTATPEVTASLSVTPTVIPTTPYPTPLTDNVPVVCGALDVNADKVLTYTDYAAMLVLYNHYCSDNYPQLGCGGKDTNSDGLINYIDLHYLVSHMYPAYIDCTRYW